MSVRPPAGASNRRRLLLAAVAVTVMAALLFSHPARSATGGISRTDGEAGGASPSPSRYERIWWSLAPSERRWANRTAECESGRNPKAIGGGGLYRGAFQFMRSTWQASPKSPGGDPITYPYRTQGVVAVLLKRRDGAGHWPVCG